MAETENVRIHLDSVPAHLVVEEQDSAAVLSEMLLEVEQLPPVTQRRFRQEPKSESESKTTRVGRFWRPRRSATC